MGRKSSRRLGRDSPSHHSMRGAICESGAELKQCGTTVKQRTVIGNINIINVIVAAMTSWNLIFGVLLTVVSSL